MQQPGSPLEKVCAYLEWVPAASESTTVRLRPIPVTCGIIQGCPLAPLLFNLALDVLYRNLDANGQACGVPVETEIDTMIVVAAGFTPLSYVEYQIHTKDSLDAAI